MSSEFVKAVQKSEISLRPILPLAHPLDIGHVGTFDGAGVFSHRGTIGSMLGLNSLGGELPIQDKRISVSVTSGRDVKVNFGAAAKADGVLAQVGNIKAKASIVFGSSNSFFLAINGLRIRQLEEPELLLHAILSAYKQRPRRWQKDWIFVDRLGIADHLTVVLAKEANTTVLLKASSSAKVASASDVDLSAGFKFLASSKGVTQITGARRAAAFYSAYRVRDRLFSGPGIERAYIMQPFGMDLEMYPSSIKRFQTADQFLERT